MPGRRVQVCSSLKEERNKVRLTPRRYLMQDCPSGSVFRMDIGAMIQKGPDALGLVPQGGSHQRRLLRPILCIYLRAVLEQQAQHGDLSLLSSP